MTGKDAMRAIAHGARMGLREGLRDLLSRMFVAGVFVGACSVSGALLYVGAIGAEVINGAVGLCIASGVIGVALFSLPNRGADDNER